jgi:hypothetical protein
MVYAGNTPGYRARVAAAGRLIIDRPIDQGRTWWRRRL